MDREVKLWAKTLLLAYPYLEKVAFLADRQLMSKAAGSWRAYGDAFDVCKGVIDTIYIKDSYINAKLVTLAAWRMLNAKFATVIELRYFKKMKIAAVAERMRMSSRGVEKMLPAAEQAFAEALLKCGKNEERLEELFGASPFLLGVKADAEDAELGGAFSE